MSVSGKGKIAVSLQSFREYVLANPSKTVEEVANLFRVSEAAIYLYALSVGVKRQENRMRHQEYVDCLSYKPRIVPFREIPAGKIPNRILYLHEKGYSYVEICMSLNVSHNLVFATIGAKLLEDKDTKLSEDLKLTAGKTSQKPIIEEEPADIYEFIRSHVTEYLETALFPDLESFLENHRDETE